jgi:hypothetical protein
MPVKRQARPWLGLIVGVILGIAVAVFVQQAGWWPLDQMLLFGSIGIFGLIGILVAGLGRARVSVIVLIIPLIIAVAAAAFGAVGATQGSGNGEINGGCTVTSSTPLDSTTVTDTSRSDPFDVDPDGFLTWEATSPAPFKDHLWNVYVEVGGGKLKIANNDEPDPNDDDKVKNGETYGSVAGYVAEVTAFNGDEVRGVFVVSGDITGGGSCDGFGYVRLVDDPFASLVSKIAGGLAILMIIILIIIFIRRSYMGEVVETVIAAGGAAAAGEGVEGVDEAVDQAVDDALEGYEPGAEDLPGTNDLA